jgi:hypothetical protein
MRRLFPSYLWLMPTGTNGDALLHVLSIATQQRRPYIELALHSSELMPGGSPKLMTPESIDALYRDLDRLFDAARDTFAGLTLAEYRERVVGNTQAMASATSGARHG